MTDRDHLQKLIKTHRRRLQLLEEQHALEGHGIKPSVVMDIEDTRQKINELQLELQTFDIPLPTETLLSDNAQIAFDYLFEQRRKQLLAIWPESRQEGANAQLDALRRAFLVMPPDLKTMQITFRFFQDSPSASQHLKDFLQTPLLQKFIRRSNNQTLVYAYEQLVFSQNGTEVNG